ncbi:MAG: DpnD/PcfM family protein [Erysipelotrichaceae bacterium]|nr:DpnD/PcfM family protein [Erysipelotrichaceae bacterium]
MKKKFIVEITETLQKQIIVEAKNNDEAVKEVEEKYHSEEIILDEDNVTNVDIVAVEVYRSYEYER